MPMVRFLLILHMYDRILYCCTVGTQKKPQPRLPQESQGPRHPSRRGPTRRIRRGTEHLRPRRGSPGTNCWRIWRDVIARRPPRRCNCGRADSRAPLLLRRQGLEDRQGNLPPGALSRVGAHLPSWVGTPYARSPKPRTSPGRPTGPKNSNSNSN